MRVNIETIVAMFCITILEIFALLKGIDGVMLSTVIAIIAGLGGFWVGKLRNIPYSQPTDTDKS